MPRKKWRPPTANPLDDEPRDTVQKRRQQQRATVVQADNGRLKKHQHAKNILWGAVLGNQMARGSTGLPVGMVPIQKLQFEATHDMTIDQMLLVIKSMVCKRNRDDPGFSIILNTKRLTREMSSNSQMKNEFLALSSPKSEVWPTYTSRTYWEELSLNWTRDPQMIEMEDSVWLCSGSPLLRAIPCALLSDTDYRAITLAACIVTHYHWSALVASIVIATLVREVFRNPGAYDSEVDYVGLHEACIHIIGDYCVSEEICPDQLEGATSIFNFYWDLGQEVVESMEAFKEKFSDMIGKKSEMDAFSIPSQEKNILLMMSIALSLVKLFVTQRDKISNQGFEETCREVASMGGFSSVITALAGALYSAYVWTDERPLPTHRHKHSIDVGKIIIPFSDYRNPQFTNPVYDG
jgi:hypothetical protein